MAIAQRSLSILQRARPGPARRSLKYLVIFSRQFFISSHIWLINGSSLAVERDSMTGIATFRSASDFFFFVFQVRVTICVRILRFLCRGLAAHIVLLRSSVLSSFALVVYLWNEVWRKCPFWPVSTFLMMAVCKWRESVTFVNKQPPPTSPLLPVFVPFGDKKAVVNLKIINYTCKRFSRLCPGNIMYCGDHLHDWQEDFSCWAPSEKKKSIQAGWLGTWQTLSANPLLLSWSYLVQNHYMAVDKSELGTYLSAFYLSSGYSFVSSAVSVLNEC